MGYDYTCSSAFGSLNTRWHFSVVSLDDCEKDEKCRKQLKEGKKGGRTIDKNHLGI